MSAELATVSFLTESGVAEDESWTVVDSAQLSNTGPWRTFRWYKGQRHYSGLYWSATMRDHVVAYTFAWTRCLVEARGWQYEVWWSPVI